MAVVYVLAHLDDEYCALPLIQTAARQGLEQHFLYVADYAGEALARTRLAETRALLAHLGLDPARAIHVGAGTGALDGAVHRHPEAALGALSEAVARIGRIERFVTTAWEGGHMDHDMCAVMTTILARARLDGPPVHQVSLYNGPGLPGPLLRGASPLAENGPVHRLRLSPADWLAWLSAVRFFPSQAWAWSGLWPAMFITCARRGFGYQQLAETRVRERPHPGPLFYERMFKVPYAEVRAAADGLMAAAPTSP